MEKKNYLIVDELNRWHDVGYDATEQEIKDAVEEVKERLKEDGEANVQLLVFEITGKPERF